MRRMLLGRSVYNAFQTETGKYWKPRSHHHIGNVIRGHKRVDNPTPSLLPNPEIRRIHHGHVASSKNVPINLDTVWRSKQRNFARSPIRKPSSRTHASKNPYQRRPSNSSFQYWEQLDGRRGCGSPAKSKYRNSANGKFER